MNETCSACGLPFKTDAMESRTLLPDGSHVHEATATSPDSMSRCRAALVARITTLEARLEKVLAVGSPWPRQPSTCSRTTPATCTGTRR